MKLAISNIAWSDADEQGALELLAAEGVEEIEIAPTKIWPKPTETRLGDIERYRADIERRGFRISSMQALLFGRGDLALFGDDAGRDEMLAYLGRIFDVGQSLGAGPLVFGSPKNRLAGGLDRDEAMQVAEVFFRRAGQMAESVGVVLCIEPNPPQYGCDFVNTLREGAELVRRVNTPGFRLHLDASSLILNEEPVEEAVESAFDCIAHFHISDPFLAVPAAHEEWHRRIAATLCHLRYDGQAAIEMREHTDPPPLEAVRRAVAFARRVYGI